MLLILLVSFAGCQAIWNTRNLQCMLKAGTAITSPTISSFRYREKASFLERITCTKAHGRVRIRCNVNLETKHERQKICNHFAAQVPVWPQKKTVHVTKMGKADCMDHVAHNFWKDEDQHGTPRVTDVCCTQFSPYPWVALQVHCCDPICY